MATCSPTTLDEALAGAWSAILTDQVDITRLTRTRDSSGGTTEGYTALATVQGHVAPTAGAEIIVADRLGIVDAYTITLPYGTDVKVSDRLAANGLLFHVQYVPLGATDQVPLACLATVVA